MWTPKFLECTFGGKKGVNYDKFEITTNCVNQIFILNAFTFFLPYYFLSNNIFCIIYQPWRWHFWSYFLLARSRIQIFTEKLKILAKNIFKKKNWNPRSSLSLFFPGLPIWSLFLKLNITYIGLILLPQHWQQLQCFFNFLIMMWKILEKKGLVLLKENNLQAEMHYQTVWYFHEANYTIC